MSYSSEGDWTYGRPPEQMDRRRWHVCSRTELLCRVKQVGKKDCGQREEPQVRLSTPARIASRTACIFETGPCLPVGSPGLATF